MLATTFWPSASTSATTSLAPMPCAAPVTMATLLASLMTVSWVGGAGLDGNREERVHPAAVADHQPLAKAQRPAVVDHGVDVAAGGEEIHGAVAHHAHHQERSLRAHRPVRLGRQGREPHQVP